MMNVPELTAHIRHHLHTDPAGIAAHLDGLRDADVADVLNGLLPAEAAAVVELLSEKRAVGVFDQPTLRRRGRIFEQLPPERAVTILAGMAADERVDAVKSMSPHERTRILAKLDASTRTEVEQLSRYPDHTAGGIMTTEFVRLDPALTAAQALEHVRAVARDRESIYACYVVDSAGKLLGAVSLRDLVVAEPNKPVADVMRRNPLSVGVLDDRLEAARKIGKYNLLAVPVIESDGRVVGFVTVDDIIDVLIEKQTEDVLRMGAVEPGALDDPYLATPFYTLVKKRAVWLVILFLSEMLTATAMGFFEDEIAKAVVLALFVPLIISSGGNSGSQAASLIIRALALREVTLGDWWKVMRREIYSGLMLGGLLGSIGFLRIAVWTIFTPIYGPHWALIGLTVGLSLVGIIMWGTLSGSMLPFILKKLGADPATSSAPFVATLVDVTGLVIYFTVAMVVLRGTLL
ncbi:MAG: magnesium transporter [Gemmataceae bacterium]